MSLKLTNRATPKQLAMLKKLGYEGQGKYAPANLTVTEAAQLLDELFEEQRLADNDIDPADQDTY